MDVINTIVDYRKYTKGLKELSGSDKIVDYYGIVPGDFLNANSGTRKL